MQDDEVQEQVAGVAKALYPRTDGLAVLQARAITHHSWSPGLMFSYQHRRTAQDGVHAAQLRSVFGVDGRMPTMTCTAVAISKR